MDISNKALALVLVAAIVVSLGGTFAAMDRLSGFSGITARATAIDTGTVQFEITSNITIEFNPDTIDWGAGYVTSGQQNCTLNTTAYAGAAALGGTNPAGCTNFSTVNTPLTVRNIGSVNVSLNITSSADAASFIGGVNPSFMINVTNNASNPGCPDELQPTDWTEVTTAGFLVCGTAPTEEWFTFNDGTGDPGAIDLNVFVRVPNDAPSGAKLATLTANAAG